jgi:hypothetical protein
MSKHNDFGPIHSVLQARYGAFTLIIRRGVPKGQRLEILEKGKTLRCVIKTSEGGRISFARRPDGSWSGLSDADRVIVAGPGPRSDELQIRMWDQAVILKAFEANYSALKAAKMENRPCWISPEHEEGRGVRGTGDGFGEKALWSEVIRSDDLETSTGTSSLAGASGERLTIELAKRGLAKTYNVRPDQIEITIRG